MLFTDPKIKPSFSTLYSTGEEYFLITKLIILDFLEVYMFLDWHLPKRSFKGDLTVKFA